MIIIVKTIVRLTGIDIEMFDKLEIFIINK
jgi:hypothetical protein